MGYYCPLHGAKGNEIPISKIRYEHFSQLTEIEEGYTVEYKSAWDEALRKKHLAKVITSFANTEGGWLFVGVKNDGSPSDIDRARTDYGQQIGQIIKSQVSPYPRFETKFAVNPENKTKGILAVYIHEGFEPPYICQGTVYLRVGSNKEPMPVKNVAEIDNLISKRNMYRGKMDKFCTNEIFPSEYKEPYCVFFMYNRSEFSYTVFDMWRSKEKADKFSKENNLQSWMITTDSILFYSSSTIAPNSHTPIIELYINGSIKIYMPLLIIPEIVNSGIVTQIKKRNSKINISEFIGIDGFVSRIVAENTLKIARDFLIKNKSDLGNYLMRVKLHNIKKCYMFFHAEGNQWIDYVCEDGFKYSNKDSATTPDRIMETYEHKKSDVTIESYIASGIYSAFGMMALDYLLLENSVRKNVMRILGGVTEFAIDDYLRLFRQ